MTVNKTVEAQRKFRQETPSGQIKVRFVYHLAGVPVFGEWVNLADILANNGLMFSSTKRHLKVYSLEVEIENQPPRKRARQ